MYDKTYADIWIKNHESRKDTFRVDHLEPYLEKLLGGLPDFSRILDVGCGWGSLIDFLKPTHEYLGVDVTEYFFDYIREKFPSQEIRLQHGMLPDGINGQNSAYDLVVCSQVLHALPTLEDSIDTLFAKSKKSGKVVLVTFNDASEEILRNGVFNPIYEEDDKHINGKLILPSGLKVSAEIFFHKERDYERAISKHGTFSKSDLGPLFVSYEITKN